MRKRVDVPADDLIDVRSTILELGGELLDETESPMGVDLYRFQIDGQIVLFFADIWGGCDFEGPTDLLDRIEIALRRNSA